MLLNKVVVKILATLNVFKQITTISNDERPVVFWHGMGDSYNSSAMQRVLETVHKTKPDLFTHSVFINSDDSLDQRSSLIGNVNEQIEQVCVQLHDIPELSDGFDFIGFSQGGLFARAAIEKCGLKVHNLITFGSPHAGVSDLPKCGQYDWFCKRKNEVLRRQVWKDKVQGSIISAQYFRDPKQYDEYLNHSRFLAGINNEIPLERNETYVENLSKIEKLVLVQFERDETLIPKESAWFYDSDGITGLSIPFNESNFYQQDCVGLKKLYDENKIDYLSIDDAHMAITDEFLVDIINKYIGTDSTESTGN